MKITLRLLLPLLIITGCSESSNYSKTPTEGSAVEESVDISKLSSTNLNLNLVSEPIMNLLTFEYSSDGQVQKILRLRNTSSSAKAISLSLEGDGYSIKLNRCPSTLAANASCQITLAFSSRSMYNGTHVGVLSISDDPTDLSLNLTSTIINKPDPNALDGSLSIAISAPFLVPNQTIAQLSRKITVSNAGPGNVSSVQAVIPAAYVIQTNRCGELKVGKSCSITLAYKDARHSLPSSASMDQIVVSGTTSPSIALRLVTGEVVGAVTITQISSTLVGFASRTPAGGPFGTTYGPEATLRTKVLIPDSVISMGALVQLREASCIDTYEQDPIGWGVVYPAASVLNLPFEHSSNWSSMVFTPDPSDNTIIGTIISCEDLGEIRFTGKLDVNLFNVTLYDVNDNYNEVPATYSGAYLVPPTSNGVYDLYLQPRAGFKLKDNFETGPLDWGCYLYKEAGAIDCDPADFYLIPPDYFYSFIEEI